MASHDDTVRLQQAVDWAINSNKHLNIVGQDSKQRFSTSRGGDLLQTRDHSGVLEYQPDELVISVRSGTSLQELRAVLAEKNQMLAADPPSFEDRGSVGGAVSSGFNGPSRPWASSLRDCVLGVEVINGLGQLLNFGGKVMKNVAGFDISRLFCGAWGTLGLITNVHLRVHPKPEVERSFLFEMGSEDAWELMKNSLAKSIPVTANAYEGETLTIRLSGAEPAIQAALKSLPDYKVVDSSYWADLRDHKLEFFQNAKELTRVWQARGVKPQLDPDNASIVEWAGAQIWYDHAPLTEVDMSRGASVLTVGQPISQVETKYTKRLRNAFDPNRIFNRDLLI